MHDFGTTVPPHRARGALFGLAVGDALGRPLEGAPYGSFAPVRDMASGPLGLPPGAFTDDTSLALCLAESLVESGGFDPEDQMRRYLRWLRDGHWSSIDVAFGIGNTTRQAIERFERTGEPLAGPTDPYTAGNGSLMRLAPVPIRYATEPARAVDLAGESSRTTHGALEAVDACRYFGGLLVAALRGLPKDALLEPRFAPVEGLWDDAPLMPTVAEVAEGSFRRRSPPEIRGTGHVVRCLEAALWVFAHTDGFEEGALRAVNLGDDADTTAAVYGQLAGAYYGMGAIPARWVQQLSKLASIRGLVERLLDASGIEAT